MIVATWNLGARATPSHEAFLDDLGADVLLLTEVAPTSPVATRSIGGMSQGQSYAALRGVQTCDDNGLAMPAFTAGGGRDGVTFLSSVLPWRSMGGDQAVNTAAWLSELDSAWPEGDVVWGGDFNHELHGRMWVGCRPGRDALLELLERRGLTCPTTMLQTRKGARSIDHIAVPSSWRIGEVRLVEADDRLSDHDAVVVECEPLAAS